MKKPLIALLATIPEAIIASPAANSIGLDDASGYASIETLLIGIGVISVAIRAGERDMKDAIREYANGWRKAINVLGAISVIKLVLDIRSIGVADLTLLAFWGTAQICLFAFAAGVIRPNRRW